MFYKYKIKGKEKGITLVALVITIIILIILARCNNKFNNRRQWIINKGKANAKLYDKCSKIR